MPIGTDNGVTSGALVHITDSGMIDDFILMPWHEERGRKIVDERTLIKWLRPYEEDFVYHEDFQENLGSFSKSGNSKSGMTAQTIRSMSECIGACWGAYEALGMRREAVMPKAWQKQFWDKVEDTKAEALKVASELQPEHDWLASSRCTTPHKGIIDAYLIAEYGRRRSLSGLLPLNADEEFEMEFVRVWNALTIGTGIPKMRGSIPKGVRKDWEQRLNSILKDDERTSWRSKALEGIEIMVQDDHCLNKTGNDWYADINYFLRVDSLDKLLSRHQKKIAKLDKAQQKEDEGNW